MTNELLILCSTAASIGIIHTLIGPDHYLPFIVLSKARKWSLGKTLFVTITCGIGHVFSSVILGFLGILIGTGVESLELIEELRGSIAAYLLIGFGFIYMIWGIKRAVRNIPHTHFHEHDEGIIHTHDHGHNKEHALVHDSKEKNLTPWLIFIIFILGPCESLIPLLMYPAAVNSFTGVILVTFIFGLFTLLTMTGIVYYAYKGLRIFNTKPIERYTHALAGFTIFISGFVIQIFSL